MIRVSVNRTGLLIGRMICKHTEIGAAVESRGLFERRRDRHENFWKTRHDIEIMEK